MGGIAERTEVRIVRGDDEDAAGRRYDAVKLLHSADYVGHVLDDMHGAKRGKRVIPERARKTVQGADDVGATAQIAIDPDGAGELVDAAAHVERALGCRRRGYGTSFRHSSSVSTAK